MADITPTRQNIQDIRDSKAAEKAYGKAITYPETQDVVTPKPPAKKAKGGSIRGGGCETKGKTKGRFV